MFSTMPRVFILSVLVLICASATFAELCNPNNAREGLLKPTLKNYVLFAGSGYTFAGSSNSTFLTGNIASFPTASPLSSNPMVTLYGTEVSDQTSTNIAASDLIDMYNVGLLKAGRSPISGDIGGLTFTPGLYAAATTISITGDLTLDAQGDSNAVFIFIAGSALFNSAGSKIILINGASVCGVYWFIGSSATLNTNSHFIGTMNAYASITVDSNCTIFGRLLARQAVTIGGSTVNIPVCTIPLADTSSCTSSLISENLPQQGGAASNTFMIGLMLSAFVAMSF
jgi:hypothetical protein